MGLLTPILIRNDYLNIFMNEKLQKKICEAIYNMGQSGRRKTTQIQDLETNITFCDAFASLGTRHSDAPRVIICYGNTWVDILEVFNDKEFNKAFLRECLKFAQRAVKQLKDVLKGKKNEI